MLKVGSKAGTKVDPGPLQFAVVAERLEAFLDGEVRVKIESLQFGCREEVARREFFIWSKQWSVVVIERAGNR